MPEVLIVDDEAVVLTALTLALEQKGFTVSTATDGREALKSLCSKSAQDETYDAIILDLVMPVIDGWQVLEAIQSNPLWRDIPVVVISGYAHNPEDYAHIAELNGVLVEKGEDFAEVLGKVVGRVVEVGQAADEQD